MQNTELPSRHIYIIYCRYYEDSCWDAADVCNTKAELEDKLKFHASFDAKENCPAEYMIYEYAGTTCGSYKLGELDSKWEQMESIMDNLKFRIGYLK